MSKSKIALIIVVSIFVGVLIGMLSSLMIMNVGEPDRLIWLALLFLILFALLGAIAYYLNKLVIKG